MTSTNTPAIPDPRHLANGLEIPTESYSDQPFIVSTDDGGWLCCVTTGPGHEGARGQHVATLRSLDQGHTWSHPVPVELPDSPENSYAVMLKIPLRETNHFGTESSFEQRTKHQAPSTKHPEDARNPEPRTLNPPPAGRVYIFYNHNTDNVREVKCHDGKTVLSRVDSLGHFVFKYSDDHGRSWSAARYDIPVRAFACDRANVYGGTLRFFWNVGKPFIHGGAAYVSLHKVGQMGEGFFQQSEGVLLKSDNLLSEVDPAKIRWETLPDGEVGLRTPPGGGPIAEEQSYCVLADGSFHCVYRSIDGHPVESYSRDGGHSWSEARYQRYADGRPMKHPRAANFAWKCANGKHLYWFHNHGGQFIRQMWGKASATNGLVVGYDSPYEDRNPVWLCGGEEVDTPAGREIRWSQPEIALYDDDPYVRISYPDLVEVDGKLFLTETQKDKARVHEIDPTLLAALWGNPGAGGPPPLLALPTPGQPMAAEIAAPRLPEFLTRDGSRFDFGTKDLRQGFTLELELELPSLEAGQMLLDSRTPWGQGLALATVGDGSVEIVLNDGRGENRWACSPGLFLPATRHRLAVIVDGGPKLILLVVDGRLDDGGEHRQFGWGRFSPNLRHANGSDRLRLGPAVRGLRIHGRARRVGEVAAAQAGQPQP